MPERFVLSTNQSSVPPGRDCTTDMNRIITNHSPLPSPADAARSICPSLKLAILLAIVAASRLAAATPQPDYLSDHPALILSSTQDWGVLGFDTADENVKTIVQTIVGLGRSLHMRVTAEGVENARQAAFVRDVDCDHVQGFYYGRPAPATELAGQMLANFQGMIPAAADAAKRSVPR